LWNLHGVVFFAVFHCWHLSSLPKSIDQLTTGRVSDRIGRSNLQGGAHWKLMMMSRFGRLVSRMVARAYDWGRWREGFSYLLPWVWIHGLCHLFI
jgi:hypothetical protein